MDVETVNRCGCWLDGTLCPPCAAALGAHVRRDLNGGRADDDTLRLPAAWIAPARQSTGAEPAEGGDR